MNKDKLILPVSILLGCIILGGFYYLTQASKQHSIEKQQQVDMAQKQAEQQAEADQNAQITKDKSACVIEAQSNAIDLYNNSSMCRGAYKSDDCNTGIYLVTQYNNAYDTCLQSKGLK
jgi:uncharacterized protein YpmB